MSLFTDRVSGAVERAMDGVALRQRVTSQNIANAVTPGYQASRVEFEGALAAALSGEGSPEGVQPAVVATGNASDLNGNNVKLEDETADLMRSGLQFDALVQAANYRHNIYHAALAR